jgi:hypothetical protein
MDKAVEPRLASVTRKTRFGRALASSDGGGSAGSLLREQIRRIRLKV